MSFIQKVSASFRIVYAIFFKRRLVLTSISVIAAHTYLQNKLFQLNHQLIYMQPMQNAKQRQKMFVFLLTCYLFIICSIGAGSTGSLTSGRSSVSGPVDNANAHLASSPVPVPTTPTHSPGLNTHGINVPGLHAQAEGVKV